MSRPQSRTEIRECAEQVIAHLAGLREARGRAWTEENFRRLEEFSRIIDPHRSTSLRNKGLFQGWHWRTGYDPNHDISGRNRTPRTCQSRGASAGAKGSSAAVRFTCRGVVERESWPQERNRFSNWQNNVRNRHRLRQQDLGAA